MTPTYDEGNAHDRDLLDLADKVLTELRGELKPNDRQALSTHVLALVAIVAELRTRWTASTTEAGRLCTPMAPGRNNCVGQLLAFADELAYQSLNRATPLEVGELRPTCI